RTGAAVPHRAGPGGRRGAGAQRPRLHARRERRGRLLRHRPGRHTPPRRGGGGGGGETGGDVGGVTSWTLRASIGRAPRRSGDGPIVHDELITILGCSPLTGGPPLSTRCNGRGRSTCRAGYSGGQPSSAPDFEDRRHRVRYPLRPPQRDFQKPPRQRQVV